MRNYSKYQELIDKVAAIDCDAAAYLLHVAPATPSTYRGGTGEQYQSTRANEINFGLDGDTVVLRNVFLWALTPQGYGYWEDLSDKVD